MFGFSKKPIVTAEIIGSFEGAEVAFDGAIAAMAALKRIELPQYGDSYLAIILGFAIFVARAFSSDKEMTNAILERHLSSYPDKPKIMQKINIIAQSKQMQHWVQWGENAIEECIETDDKVAPMMRLAEKFLSN